MPGSDIRTTCRPCRSDRKRTADRADPLTWSNGPTTLVNTMWRPSGVHEGVESAAQGSSQPRSRTRSWRPFVPTTTIRAVSLGRSRSKATHRPSGDTCGSISWTPSAESVNSRTWWPCSSAITMRAALKSRSTKRDHTKRVPAPSSPPLASALVAAGTAIHVSVSSRLGSAALIRIPLLHRPRRRPDTAVTFDWILIPTTLGTVPSQHEGVSLWGRGGASTRGQSSWLPCPAVGTGP